MLIGLAVLVGLVLIVALPFIVMTPRAPKPSDVVDSVERLETYLSAITANETPPALDIVVMKDGDVVYAKAFGVADGPTRKPATAASVYHFWSATKLFTATAVMQLVDDGRLSLEDPVSKYLPDFRTVGATGTPTTVTIRQLLDHTSGMADLGPLDLLGWIHQLVDRPVNQTSFVREKMAAYKKLNAKPGDVSAYSNAGYIVLGAVIEAASDQPYEDFVRTRILDPLGMASTDFVYRGDLLARASAGSHPLFHAFTPLLLMVHRDWFTQWVSKTEKQRMWLAPLYTDYTAPTGLIGTGEDLARFGEAMLRGGELNGKRILRSETAAAMLDNGYGDNSGPDKDRMGLGWHWWNNAPLPFKGHGGSGPGFGSQLAIFQDQKMVVVVLANCTLIDRVGLTNLIAGVFK